MNGWPANPCCAGRWKPLPGYPGAGGDRRRPGGTGGRGAGGAGRPRPRHRRRHAPGIGAAGAGSAGSKDAPDFVLIHDAARPLVSRKVIGDVVAALEAGADGALPMLAASDTLAPRAAMTGAGPWCRAKIFIAPRRRRAFVYAKILKAHRDHAARRRHRRCGAGGTGGIESRNGRRARKRTSK